MIICLHNIFNHSSCRSNQEIFTSVDCNLDVVVLDFQQQVSDLTISVSS